MVSLDHVKFLFPASEFLIEVLHPRRSGDDIIFGDHEKSWDLDFLNGVQGIDLPQIDSYSFFDSRKNEEQTEAH